ncbi:MAG: asparagine synthase (glutamine-hydrolyzing) [Cyclobacteriaceae bacterium]
MCGIAGILGSNNTDAMHRMVGAMHHRGPDDRGFFAEDHVLLGMTRLAIIDLSADGHQPMQSGDGRYWIVYNGECYNFRDIRQQLEREGVRFQSASDTEVVLEAYVRWGAGSLSRFNGMYAFAIWDTRDKKLFAARDRMGIKPFYYAQTSEVFVFGSEIKTLLSSGFVDFDLSSEALREYFTFGYIQQPHTILKQGSALMPGHYLEWSAGSYTITKYWDFDAVKPSQLSYEDAREQMLDLIQNSVRMELVSDRPLGLFLSGGLDSATILAAMKLHGVNAHTFSIGFEENTFARNEAGEAIELARHFGASHEQIILNADLVRANIPDFFDALDQPSIDGFNTYLVSKYASKSMTVALSGLGGDELFAGYARHALLNWKSHHRTWQSLSRLVPLSLAHRLGNLGELLWRLRAYGESDDLLLNYTVARTVKFSSSHVLRAGLFDAGDYAELYRNTFRHLDTGYANETLRRILKLDVSAFMSSLLLRDMDATSMAHSLEVRFPLIDHQLVEFAFSLPDDFKLHPAGQERPKAEGKLSYRESGAKRILLDIMEPQLPAGFSNRAKNGFKLPLNKWLSEMSGDSLREMLFDDQTAWEPYCDPARVEAVYDSFVQKKKTNVEFWKVLTFVRVVVNLKKTWEAATKASR